jgi:hypothetical protein
LPINLNLLLIDLSLQTLVSVVSISVNDA